MAFADDYVDVAERVRIFRQKFPDGSLQPADPANPVQVMTIGGKTFLAYTAAAYRSPDDTRPGIGVAWEPFPGLTNFTRNSEAMNAETSAWGRAIVAALAADTKKIASAEEVRNRKEERENPLPVTPDEVRAQIKAVGDSLDRSIPELAQDFFDWSQGKQITTTDVKLLQEYLAFLSAPV